MKSAKEIREQRVMDGLCPICGKRPMEAGFKSCFECRMRSSQLNREAYKRRKVRKMLKKAESTGDVSSMVKLIESMSEEIALMDLKLTAATKDLRSILRGKARLCKACAYYDEISDGCNIDPDDCYKKAEWRGITDGREVVDYANNQSKKKAEYMSRLRAERIEMGLCPGCGGKREDDSKILCESCRLREKIQHIKHPPSQDARERNAAQKRERQKRNREAGLCACGREVTDGYKSCEKCRERSRKIGAEWYRRKHGGKNDG